MGQLSVAAFLLVAVGAGSDASPAGLEGVVATKAADCGIAMAALYIAQEFRPEVDVTLYERKLDVLARELAVRLDPSAPVRDRLQAMAGFLHRENKFGDAKTLAPAVFVGLHEVLDHRQWNCLGLSALYISLGERVGVPLRLVVGPGHALVQYRDAAQVFYIETTDGGRIETSLEYLKAFLPYPDVDPGRFVVLEKRQAVSALLSQTTVGVFRGGRDAEAVPYFRQAINVDAGNAQAWTGLAMALATTADGQEEALTGFRRAIELDPKSVEAHGGLGNLLYAQGKLDEAITVYRHLVELAPREPRANFNLACMLKEAGDREAAMRECARFVETDGEKTPTPAPVNVGYTPVAATP